MSSAFLYSTDILLFRWEQILPMNYRPLLQSLAPDHRPVYAALFEFEQPNALERIGGHWRKLATIGHVNFWHRQP
ncbi:MAG TPA: hypothetical protein VGM64_18200 [Lacunisphaera sp.]